MGANPAQYAHRQRTKICRTNFAGQQETFSTGADASVAGSANTKCRVAVNDARCLFAAPGIDHDRSRSADQTWVASISAARRLFRSKRTPGLRKVVSSVVVGLGETVSPGRVNPDEFFLQRSAAFGTHRSPPHVGARPQMCKRTGSPRAPRRRVEKEDRRRFSIKTSKSERPSRALIIEEQRLPMERGGKTARRARSTSCRRGRNVQTGRRTVNASRKKKSRC